MTADTMDVVFDGISAPTIHDIQSIARGRARLIIGPKVQADILRARAVVDRALAADVPVYGLTTALGAGVDTRLDADDLVSFQLRVPQARAVGVGPALPTAEVRAMMAARIAGMAAGGTGVSLAVFDGLVAALNAGVHPVVPSLGSIGAADLAPLAHMGRALLGHGTAEFKGDPMPAATALSDAGLSPLPLGPKDGHALVVANSLSVGKACLILADLERLLSWIFRATALSLEAFRANLSVLDERALAARPAFDQCEAGARLRQLLAGSDLLCPDMARRVQDPLSYRCAPQFLGALLHAQNEAGQATQIELASSGDNPVVMPEEGQMLAQGNFDLTAFTLSWERLGQALAHTAVASAWRIMKIMSPSVSDLPRFLTPLGQSRAGFATVQKTVSALESAIRHLAFPVSLAPLPVADGVEDHASVAPAVLDKTATMIARMRYLVAIELITAAQAVELRGDTVSAPATIALLAEIRSVVPSLTEDRALGPDFELLASHLATTG